MNSPTSQRWPRRFGFLLGFVVAVLACASNVKELSTLVNPAPEMSWSSFAHFEVKKIEMGAPYSGQAANQKALEKIQKNFDLRVNPLVATWNAKAKDPQTGKTLLIEPGIVEIKFINATARVWGRAFAGDSGVILKIRFVEKDSGKEIATPQFYQRANAHGGAFSFGATDNNMLVRITEVASKYIAANYDQAVGGPTGAEGKK